MFFVVVFVCLFAVVVLVVVILRGFPYFSSESLKLEICTKKVIKSAVKRKKVNLTLIMNTNVLYGTRAKARVMVFENRI